MTKLTIGTLAGGAILALGIATAGLAVAEQVPGALPQAMNAAGLPAGDGERFEREDRDDDGREYRHDGGYDEGRRSDGPDLGVKAILDAVEAAGYAHVSEIERERGAYEVKARDTDGRRMELYVAADTGEILKVERD